MPVFALYPKKFFLIFCSVTLLMESWSGFFPFRITPPVVSGFEWHGHSNHRSGCLTAHNAARQSPDFPFPLKKKTDGETDSLEFLFLLI